jgi:steroid delta-isomerase-like uncharacterized protein
MTADEVRAFVERHTASFRARDVAAFVADYAEDAILETPSSGTHRGRREIAESLESWHAAFPAEEITLERIIAENDQVAVFFQLVGTHQGDFLGLPPTGKRIEIRGVLLQRFEHDLIVHERRLYDFSGLLIKLGVLKVKPV